MRMKRKFLRECFSLIVIASIAGFAVNLVHPKGYLFISRADARNKRIVFISAAEAKIKFDHAAAVFADSRDEEEFALMHIPGAFSIPASPESVSIARIKSVLFPAAAGKEIVSYCSGEGCRASEVLAERILVLGYAGTAYVLDNGLPAWRDRGYPVKGTGAGKK